MTHRTRFLVLLALLTLALSACHRRHRQEQVVVAQTSGGAVAQPTTISHRHYRNLLRIAGRDMGCHPRQLAPQEVSPGIFSVQGCGVVRDYVMVCRGRHHCRWVGVQPVEQVAVADAQCAAGTVQLGITGPLTRQVIACGQTLDYALACNPSGCGWTRGAASSGMVMQTEPGTSVVIVAEDPGAPPPPVATAAPSEESDEIQQVGVAGTLQSLFATQIAAVRQCTGGQPATVRVMWDVAGTVSIALAPPFAGTPTETCVQQAVGPVVLQGAGGPGEIHVQL